LRRLAAAVASAALLLACTPGGDGGAGAPAAAGSHVGGTLVVAVGEPGSVDPLDAYEPNGLLIARTMCDTLIDVDPRTGAIRPGLASSWTISDHGSQMSFRIRKGARFSDGRRVTADDVVYSLSRAASPGFAGRAADLLEPIAGWPEMRGVKKSSDPRVRRRLLGVQAVTGDTVRVLLQRSQADAINLFSHPVTAPVSRHATAADPDRAARQPVCSGPYRLDRPWSPGDTSLVLSAVRSYRGRSPVRGRGGAGYAARIEVRIGPQAAGAALDSRGGAAPAPGLTRVTGPAPGAELIGLPQGQSSPYRLAAIRRALSLALDRTRLVERTGGGRRQVARGFIPPTVAGTHRAAPCRTVIPAAADVARARALLGGAAVDLRAAPIRLTYNDEGTNRAVVEDVAAQWRENLGLTVEVRAVPFAEMLSAAAAGSGLPGPFRISWAAAYPSADAHLAPLFSAGATNLANLGRWNDPQLERALAREARRAGDAGDRRLAYRLIEQRLCQTMPAIPLTWARAAVDVDLARVAAPAGRFLDPTTGLPDLRQVWLRS
jgi:ABC-type oligopeptide transport system substrate-binding subunit